MEFRGWSCRSEAYIKDCGLSVGAAAGLGARRRDGSGDVEGVGSGRRCKTHMFIALSDMRETHSTLKYYEN